MTARWLDTYERVDPGTGRSSPLSRDDWPANGLGGDELRDFAEWDRSEQRIRVTKAEAEKLCNTSSE